MVSSDNQWTASAGCDDQGGEGRGHSSAVHSASLVGGPPWGLRLSVAQGRAVVAQVSARGLAAGEGVCVGDVVLSVNGLHAGDTSAALLQQAGKRAVGVLRLTLLRHKDGPGRSAARSEPPGDQWTHSAANGNGTTSQAPHQNGIADIMALRSEINAIARGTPARAANAPRPKSTAPGSLGNEHAVGGAWDQGAPSAPAARPASSASCHYGIRGFRSISRQSSPSIGSTHSLGQMHLPMEIGAVPTNQQSPQSQAPASQWAPVTFHPAPIVRSGSAHPANKFARLQDVGGDVETFGRVSMPNLSGDKVNIFDPSCGRLSAFSPAIKSDCTDSDRQEGSVTPVASRQSVYAPEERSCSVPIPPPKPQKPVKARLRAVPQCATFSSRSSLASGSLECLSESGWSASLPQPRAHYTNAMDAPGASAASAQVTTKVASASKVAGFESRQK